MKWDFNDDCINDDEDDNDIKLLTRLSYNCSWETMSNNSNLIKL